MALTFIKEIIPTLLGVTEADVPICPVADAMFPPL